MTHLSLTCEIESNRKRSTYTTTTRPSVSDDRELGWYGLCVTKAQAGVCPAAKPRLRIFAQGFPRSFVSALRRTGRIVVFLSVTFRRVLPQFSTAFRRKGLQDRRGDAIPGLCLCQIYTRSTEIYQSAMNGNSVVYGRYLTVRHVTIKRRSSAAP